MGLPDGLLVAIRGTMSQIDSFPKDGSGDLIHQDFFPLGVTLAWVSNHELLLDCTGPLCKSGKGVPSSGCRGPSSRVHNFASAL